MSATTAASRSRRGKDKQRGTRPATAMTCRSCGETNQASARYCQGCGRSVTGGGGWFDASKLTVLGTGALTLVVLGLLFASVIETGPTFEETPLATTPSRTASTPTGQPPDLSTMSPREAADRLFNRVMMADEQGNRAEVEQFAPMAVAAYDRLDKLDLDAVYHLGLIHAAAGDADSVRNAIKRLQAVVPGHLLAILLEHRLAMDENDQEKAERTIEQFEAHYQDEIKIDRLEYRDHRRSIDRFREQIGATAREGE